MGYVGIEMSLRSAERYDFRAKSWRKLPKMRHISGIVGLCIHSDFIFLTDLDSLCERYSLLSNTYTSLPLELPDHHTLEGYPFIYENQLCGLYDHFDQWDVNTGELIRCCGMRQEVEYSQVVVRGGYVYYMRDVGSPVKRIDLEAELEERGSDTEEEGQEIVSRW